jgi:hypothetical protein
MDALRAFLRSRITVMAASADVSITELFFPKARVRCATGHPRYERAHAYFLLADPNDLVAAFY